MSNFISKRRLVGLISASAVIGSMAVAALPGATFAASCTATGFVRDGIDLTAARIGGSITGAVDATGCDIGVYKPTRVTGADIHGARYYGIVVNGGTVNTTNSKVHGIGDTDPSLYGMQRGRAILYINGASGTISGNKVYNFQKNGIEVRGVTADASAPSSTRTSATIANNVITGRGPVDYIAQNGIVILGNASATVKDNTVSGLWYTPAGTEATGLLNADATGRITVSGNKFVDTEVRIDGAVTANVLGGSTTTVGAHSVRVDLHSYAKPVAQATLGTKLDWRITVDGSTRLHVKQGFSERTVYYEHFKGRHVIRVFKNGELVRRVVKTF